jgi:hypothetical protein
MANANTPLGLQPINENGTPWSGQGRMVFLPASLATSVFDGDPIVYLGGSDAFGVPIVGPASAGAGNPIAGVTFGPCNGPAGSGVTLTRDQPPYTHVGGIQSYALMADDPNILFVVQEDSVGGAITAAVGAMANGNLVAGVGSAVTGYSGWQLQSSSVTNAANTTYQVRLLGLARGPDNALGINAKWVVRLNNPQLWGATGV